MLRLGGGYFVILQERSRNDRGGKEGRAPGYILNITDGLTNEIILIITLSVILSVSIPCYCKICYFESHCITVRNVIGI